MKEENIPNHVGIIMDGNRRWAKEKGKKTIDGYLAGPEQIMYQNIKNIVDLEVTNEKEK